MNDPAETLSQAMQLHQSGAFAQAEGLCQELLQADPGQARAWHLLGLMSIQLGKAELAVGYTQRAVRLEPASPLFVFHLGLAYQSLKKLEEAVTCYNQAVGLAPNFAEAHHNLGNAWRDLGKLDEAVVSFRQALRCNPNLAESHNNLGSALWDLGKLDQSASCFETAIRLKPELVEALGNLAGVLEAQGNREDAITCYQEILRCRATDLTGHNDPGKALRAQGKLDEALAYYRQALGCIGNDAGAHSNLGNSPGVDPRVIDSLGKGAPALSKPVAVPETSLVVYTAVTGEYDELKEQPRSPQSDVAFVAFVDKPVRTQTWQLREVHKGFQDPNRNAKIHKILPHLFFPDKMYSLWMDGSVRIEYPFSLTRLAETYLSDCDLALFPHPERHCVYQEANACIHRQVDDVSVIRNQIQRYTREGYPPNAGLCACTVLLRRHTEPIREFCEAWWEEISKGSRRDQISFMYVARKMGIRYRHFPGDIHYPKGLFLKDPHKWQRPR